MAHRFQDRTNERAEVVTPAAIGNCRKIHVNDGEHTRLDDQIKGPLGQKRWTVVYELQQTEQNQVLSSAIEVLRDEVDHLKVINSRQEQKHDVVQQQTVEPFLRNAAASILLFLDGSQPKASSPSYRFKGQKRAAESRRLACAADIGYTDLKFTTMADGILDRRNAATHPGDVRALDAMIATANNMISAFPNVRGSIKDEVAVIEQYSTIKAHFP